MLLFGAVAAGAILAGTAWSVWLQYLRAMDAVRGVTGPHPLVAWRTDASASALLAVTAAVALMAFAVFLARKVAVEGHLRQVERQHENIIDQAMDAIVTVDESQHVVSFNKAAEQVFGVSAAQALGQPLNNFLPERYHAVHSGHVQHFARTGTTARRMGERRALHGRRADGSEFPLDASISRSMGPDGMLFTVILRNITLQVQAEEALRKSHQELQMLARSANEALESQRRRVARELHDELGGALTALKMDMAMCGNLLPPDSPALHERLEQMRGLVDALVAASRRISAELRPLMLDDLGLGAALEWLVQDFSRRHGVQSDLQLDPTLVQLREPYASAVFRIVQESLTNVARHAQAQRVDVGLQLRDGQVWLEVRDDGRGIDAAGPRKTVSHGLLGIRERARLLAGEAHIEPAAGGGTRVRAHFPLPDTERELEATPA